MEYIPVPLPLHKVPEELIAAVAEQINNRTVALVRCRQYANGFQEALQIGSGTLLRIGNRYGILTAYHVAKELDGASHLGLDILDSPSSFIIDKDYIQIITIAKPVSESAGPDLAFIVLTRNDAETIKASTTFFHSIDRDLSERGNNEAIGNTGVWFLCGVPEEKTAESGAWSHYQKVYAFQHYTFPGIIDSPFTDGEYDFVEMEINYSQYENPPVNFGGMSGGGLWQVTIEQLADGEIKPLSFHLSGVIFYQSDFIDGKRRIRCHFRNSIKRVLDVVNSL